MGSKLRTDSDASGGPTVTLKRSSGLPVSKAARLSSCRAVSPRLGASTMRWARHSAQPTGSKPTASRTTSGAGRRILGRKPDRQSDMQGQNIGHGNLRCRRGQKTLDVPKITRTPKPCNVAEARGNRNRDRSGFQGTGSALGSGPAGRFSSPASGINGSTNERLNDLTPVSRSAN